MITQSILVLFGSFFILLFTGVPISAGIGLASCLTAFSAGKPMDKLAFVAEQKCFDGVDSFPCSPCRFSRWAATS